MFGLENPGNGNGSRRPKSERGEQAYEAKLAIVEYFEGVATDPTKFDRRKMRALNEIWARVPSAGFSTADLSQRLQNARLKIRAQRARPL